MHPCYITLLYLLAHIVWLSFLWYKAITIVINFLILWFICWSTSLVHFKNGLEKLLGVSAGFFPLMRFLLYSLVSRCFLFFSSPLVWRNPFPIFSIIFLQAFWFFLELIVLFVPLSVFSYSSISGWYIFIYRILFLYPGCIVCIRVSNRL